MTHFIGMAGLPGCLPNSCQSYDSQSDAAESLAHMLGIGPGRQFQLYRDSILYLDDGNEYAEIIECDCADPEQHDDC